MPRHPTIAVPNVGLLDHAWDLLGDWSIVLEPADGGAAVAARLTVSSWETVTLDCRIGAGAMLGWPDRIRLARVTPIRRTEAGGGALEWELASGDADGRWLVTGWPGDLQIAVCTPEDAARRLALLRGRRSREYYRRKYPLAPV